MAVMLKDALQSLVLDDSSNPVLSLLLSQGMHLDNRIKADCMSMEGNNMAYKIRRAVVIDGKQRWITANSEQEYAEKLASLFHTSNNADSR